MEEKEVFTAIFAVVCFEGWEIAKKENRRMFSNAADVNDALARHVKNTLTELCKDTALDYGERICGILRVAAESEHRVAYTREQLDRRLEHEGGCPQGCLDDLMKTRLMDHDREGGYRVMHDLLLQPIRDNVGTASQGSTPLPTEEDLNKERRTLDAALEFAELALNRTSSASQAKQARADLLRLWPLVKDKPGFEHYLRRFAAALRLTPGRSIDRTSRHEILRPESGLDIWSFEARRIMAHLSIDDRLVVCSFTGDENCVVALDEKERVYLWDLQGQLILRLPGDSAMFGALTLSPEEIIQAISGHEPVRAVVPEPMIITFEDLTAEPEVEWQSI